MLLLDFDFAKATCSNRSRLIPAALLRFRDVTLLPTLDRKFPAVAVGIVEPEPHVR